MTRAQVLVVGEEESTRALCQAVDHAGAEASAVSPQEAVEYLRTCDPSVLPSAILVGPTFPVGELDRLRASVLDSAPAPPAILCYAEQDRHGGVPASTVAALAAHLDAGLDYLLPPFDPQVIRRRLAQCLGEQSDRGAVELVSSLARYERELQIAHDIQTGFLPPTLPTCRGWDLAVGFQPARDVAGDFYDAFELVNGRRMGFLVADVCDKGVGSALFMAIIRTLLRHSATQLAGQSVVGLDAQWQDEGSDPSTERILLTSAGVGPLISAVVGTDEYLVRNHLVQGYFATMMFGVLDPATGLVVYVNCGHNPPQVVRTDGTVRGLPPTGPALGLVPGSTFRIGRVVLEPGETLFLYTDGVTEARAVDREFFGEDRLEALLTGGTWRDAGELVARVSQALQAHVGAADQFDDITMMALHRRQDDGPGPGGVPGRKDSSA